MLCSKIHCIMPIKSNDDENFPTALIKKLIMSFYTLFDAFVDFLREKIL